MSGGAGKIGAAALLAFLASASTELAKAETSDAEGRLAFDQGVISGKAKACGLDWRALSFGPMMAYWRRIGKSERDTAFLAAMHGAGQGTSESDMAGKDCTAAMRQKVRSQLPFKR